MRQNQNQHPHDPFNEAKGQDLNQVKNEQLTCTRDPFMARLTCPELAALSNTSLLFHEGFKVKLAQEKLNELVKRVAWGDKEGAEAMLEKYPALLLEKGGVAPDVFSREGMDIKGGLTPFQVALSVRDVGMGELIKPYFDRLENGPALMQAQFYEFFTGGLEAHNVKQEKKAFDFSVILAAILRATSAEVQVALSKAGAQFSETDTAREKPDDELTLVEALNRFRERFAQQKIFNPYHLLRVFEIYTNQFKAFQTWDQRDLFCIQLIGFIQCSLPICYGLGFAQGRYNPSVEPISGLGFDYLACVGACIEARAGALPALAGLAGSDFRKLCQTKTAGLLELMQHNPHTPGARVCNSVK